PAAEEAAGTAILVAFRVRRGRGTRGDAAHPLAVVLDRVDGLPAATAAAAEPAAAPASSLGTDEHERPAVTRGDARRNPHRAARHLPSPPLESRPVDLGLARRRGVPRPAAAAEIAVRTRALAGSTGTCAGAWSAARAGAAVWT